LTFFHDHSSILHRRVPFNNFRGELGLPEIIPETNKTPPSGSKTGFYRVFHQPSGTHGGKAKIEAQNNTEGAKKQ
jgi:hypothetical protein